MLYLFFCTRNDFDQHLLVAAFSYGTLNKFDNKVTKHSIYKLGYVDHIMQFVVPIAKVKYLKGLDLV
jgi:hypothetical protein